MIATQACSAVLIGNPDTALALRGGRVTMDDSASPHVEADLEIATPNLATLALLDPRENRRLRITVTITGLLTVVRTFDLGLRGRRPSALDSTLGLTLASDEALLLDAAPATDAGGAYALQTSLRAIVNWVLGAVIPGAQLEAAPANDADMTSLDNATNLATNGGVRQNLTGWTTSGTLTRVAGGPGKEGISHYMRATFNGNTGGGLFHIGGEWAAPTTVPVSAGSEYRVCLWVRPSVAVTVNLNVEWSDSNGNYVGQTMGVGVDLQAGVWRKLVTTVTAPPNAARAGTYCYRPGGTNWPANSTFDGTGHRFSAKPDSEWDGFEFFDGDTLDTDAYTYSWTGASGASGATRFNVYGRSPELLLWKAGHSALEFIVALVQYAGYRIVCDEQRRWTLRDANYVAPGSLTIRDGVNLIDGSDVIDRAADLWHDAAVAVYTWTDESGTRWERTDSFQLTGTPKRVKRFNFSTPYPGPGFAEYATRRAATRGREVTAELVATGDERAEQPTTIILAGAPAQTGRAGRVELDLETNRVTITARTADTLPGAIDLMTNVTINNLPAVTINNL